MKPTQYRQGTASSPKVTLAKLIRAATPGPWIYDDFNNYIGPMRGDGNLDIVCDIVDDRGRPHDPDARLIALVPELAAVAEAAQRYVRMRSSTGRARQRAKLLEALASLDARLQGQP